MRTSLFSLAALMAISPQVMAEEAPDYQQWGAGFIEYYNPDSNKPEPIGYLTDGFGIGAEYGYRLSQPFAVRLEWSHVNLDTEQQLLPLERKTTGSRAGVDAMYFLPDDIFYVFGGLKTASYGDDHQMANIGWGKHWKLDTNWRVVTEVAGYHDFGERFRDWGMKLGLAYTFGGKASSGAPAAADSDRDGVPDRRDQCPNSAEGAKVDATGCDLDSDRDGVPNNIDQCPDSAAGAKVDATGCERDSDGDGVLDSADQCPNTPAGQKVDARGCSIDDDMDGVLNAVDACPNTPAGTEVGAKGCSLALDSDQDGVLDDVDNCPETPMTDKVDAQGCSVFEDKEVTVSLAVLFANNSADIANPDDAQFSDFAQFMRRFPNTQAVIEGHSSAVGAADYNQVLSERRAKAVTTLLSERYGIAAERLRAVGYGESRLLDDANTESAHRRNRRIEAVVTAMEKVTVPRGE